ncbi:hypothetical protein [Xanthocytophaga agilis]|nr:hypothetical protein [Xanthocytophaga agilis]
MILSSEEELEKLTGKYIAELILFASTCLLPIAMLWLWKGGVKDGTGVADYHSLSPILSSNLTVNPNLKQNSEAEYRLLIR